MYKFCGNRGEIYEFCGNRGEIYKFCGKMREYATCLGGWMLLCQVNSFEGHNTTLF